MLEKIDLQVSEFYKYKPKAICLEDHKKYFYFELQSVAHEMDMSYGILGSLFRSGKCGVMSCKYLEIIPF